MAETISVGDRNYVRMKDLANGGFCRVYLARDEETGREVALRQLKDTGEAGRELFRNGIRAHGALAGSKVFPELYAHTDRTSAVEYFQGRPLQSYGNQSEGVVLATVLQLAQCISEAHKRGVIHRDVNPKNIIVISNGSFRLIDLDTAGFADGEDSLKDFCIGTRGYMSPEQERGKRADRYFDLYAIGSTAYRMFVGRDPPSFDSDDGFCVPTLGDEVDLNSHTGQVIAGCWRIRGRFYADAGHLQIDVSDRLSKLGIKPKDTKKTVAAWVQGN